MGSWAGLGVDVGGEPCVGVVGGGDGEGFADVGGCGFWGELVGFVVGEGVECSLGVLGACADGVDACVGLGPGVVGFDDVDVGFDGDDDRAVLFGAMFSFLAVWG